MKLKHLLLSAAIMFASLLASSQSAPKYIFYFIGDGMGLSPVMAAQSYTREVLRSDTPLLMLQFPVASWAMTYSANKSVTDSAAAGTALSTGSKTNNGMLGMNADTVSVTSIARQLKDRGYGVGLVTSVAADDATPGAFYAHVPQRKMFNQIDMQNALSGYDFVGGAGLQGLADKEGNPSEAKAELDLQGVQIVRGIDGIKSIDADRVILLADEGRPNYNIGYTIDSVPGVLTLPIITQACLNHLIEKAPDSFFMMVEGGNIDHALHANDGGTAIKEILNFDQSLAIAYNFYLQHPSETLIVVTADHDTGGLSLVYSSIGFHNPLSIFDYQRASKEEFSNFCKAMLRSRRVFRWEDMQEYMQEKLGLFSYVPVNEEKTAELKALFNKTFELRNTDDQKTLYANFNAFAVEVFKLLNDAAGIKFTTVGHSGNPVPVFAIGVGAEVFHSVNNNTDLPKHIRKIAGLE